MVVAISCKPYVATYLRNHYDVIDDDGVKAINLSASPFIKDYFVSLLAKKSSWRDKQTTLIAYNEVVNIFISMDDFRRHGVFLTKTSIVRFNTFLEGQIKEKSRLYVAVHHRNRGIKKAVAIRKFQDEFGFSESDFPFETIKKDIDRHVDFDNISGRHYDTQLSMF